MRESWTDERLDEFAKHVDHRFDQVDGRFDRLETRFDGLQRTLLQIAGGTIATLVAGFAGVIATQL